MELGTDFAFVARQKRITVDDEDYYLDLLFQLTRPELEKHDEAAQGDCAILGNLP